MNFIYAEYLIAICMVYLHKQTITYKDINELIIRMPEKYTVLYSNVYIREATLNWDCFTYNEDKGEISCSISEKELISQFLALLPMDITLAYFKKGDFDNEENN